MTDFSNFIERTRPTLACFLFTDQNFLSDFEKDKFFLYMLKAYGGDFEVKVYYVNFVIFDTYCSQRVVFCCARAGEVLKAYSRPELSTVSSELVFTLSRGY